METIHKNTDNTLVFTLDELSTLAAPYYLFSFTNDSSGEETLFNMVDISPYPRRYNKFILTESIGSPVDPSSGIVELDFGWGKYKIYESVTQTLDIAATTGSVLEYGKYFVAGFEDEFDNNTNSVYDNGSSTVNI